MKKYYLLTFALTVFLAVESNAQFTKLLDFNGANGDQSHGTVVTSADGSVLFGMTNGGGTIPNSAGVIYSINTDGTNYQNLHTFTADAISGSSPYGSLARSGDVLYGMTSGYGQNNAGTIFSIHTDGSNYIKLHDFSGGSSGNPYGTLTISGNVMYGMTYGSGGSSTKGTLFSIHTDGSGFANILSFNGINGQHPGFGALTLSGNKLFGTTLYGGTSGIGALFSINTDGSGYQKLIDFNTANGSMPRCAPVLSGNVLYGVCGGGSYGKGLIYSINTDGTGYKKLLEFDGINGQNPQGGLTVSDERLYGTTSPNGTDNSGTVFSINMDGSGFQTLFSFNGANGNLPRGELVLSNNVLYGTTTIGGLYDKGVVFSLKAHPPAVPICMVTVDENSNYNHIVWEKPLTTNIDSFIIYREITTNNYKQIGAVLYNELSEFIDTAASIYFPFTGNPNAGTYRYKLQVRDVNGNYSLLSPYHNTLYINRNGGTFSWDPYTIEGDSVPLPSLTSYVLYRDDNGSGAWHSIQAVSGSQTTISDPDYSNFPEGSWRVETNWNISCTPTARMAMTHVGSKSNIKSMLSTADHMKVFPNPASNELCIKFNGPAQKADYVICNLLGQEIKKGIVINNALTVGDIMSGAYLLKVITETNQITNRILINH